MNKFKFSALFLSFAILFASCASMQSNTAKGGAIGAGSGAALGAIIGGIAGKGKGAVIGAAIGTAVGGGTGAIIGKKMDKKAAEAAAIEGAQVEKVQDTNGLAAVKVTFDSGILFDFNSSTLSPASRSSLSQFADILRQDPTIDIAVFGKTDKVGTYDANMTVSNRRAQSVKSFLQSQGVNDYQFKSVQGVGYTQYDEALLPAQNRVVDIYMYASEAMINKANAEAGY
ncbi:OmpA/MotB domain protein [Bacteroides coprosuis DSM 18011]|mgnify:CR=1 FL=1|uniref:OmpA/MotB domain protein n=1 Tax=Bacteroides coprosuis DSM 18011 TaxID=679937 RepID=F3ZUB6_9BACE|nr:MULTISPECIES: OmpA family protein [Bacteroides]EGJ71361.1 OmpA/MotB domain protein [Bacteroides coprosuis DSM 18011]HJD91378.1 OmpA family protein [Bacteroides coprosuis]